MPIKVRDLIRLLEDAGWVLVAQKGSHRQYRHPQRPGRLTVPGKSNDELARGIEESILKYAGLKRRA